MLLTLLLGHYHFLLGLTGLARTAELPMRYRASRSKSASACAATPRKGSTKSSLYQKQATPATWPGSACCLHDEQEGAFVASATTARERDEERARSTVVRPRATEAVEDRG